MDEAGDGADGEGEGEGEMPPSERGDPEPGADVHENRSMRAQLLMEGSGEGLIGMAAGAVMAAGATLWVKLRRRR